MPTFVKSPLLQAVFILSAVIAAYIWLQTPILEKYSLQAFSLVALVFFVLKRVKKAKIWHILPENLSIEMALISFAILILVGSTGNMDSPFFVLTYVHLYFLVVSSRASTAISTTIAIMIFHYAITPNMSTSEASELFVLPLLLIFFLSAKKQYDEIKQENQILEHEAILAEQAALSEQKLESFVVGFLKPKLSSLHTLATNQKTDLPELATQISLIEAESDKVLEKIKLEQIEKEETSPSAANDRTNISEKLDSQISENNQ